MKNILAFTALAIGALNCGDRGNDHSQESFDRAPMMSEDASLLHEARAASVQGDDDIKADDAHPVAKVIRAGKGRIGSETKFPDAFKVKSIHPNGKYPVKRLPKSILPQVPDDIRNSWDPLNFTNLAALELNQQLTNLTLIVHGLELTTVVNGMSMMAFDDFVATHLYPEKIYRGTDFIKFYPYFFNKKVVISASMITEKNTSTFGRFGFILSVPSGAYLAASKVDMGTPTDNQFYSDEDGTGKLKETIANHPLVLLSEFLPKDRLPVDRLPFQTAAVSDPDEYIKRQKFVIAAKLKELMNRPVSEAALRAKVDEVTASWYTEVAIKAGSVSSKTGQKDSVSIVGVFVRAGKDADVRQLAKASKSVFAKAHRVFVIPVS